MEIRHKAEIHNSSLLAKTIQTFTSIFGVLGIGVLSAIILSRGLTPDDRGVYLGISMWNGFILGICDVGIYMATVYLWGKSLEHERNDLFRTLLVWALATGGIAVIVIMLITEWTIKGHLEGSIKLAAYLFFLSTFSGPLTSMLSGVLAAQQRFLLINLVRMGIPTVLTALWTVYFIFGTLSVSLCLITSATIAFASVFPFLWQARSYLKSSGRFQVSILRSGVWYSIKGFGGSVINVLGNGGSQILLFSLTPSALALYQTASSATGILWAIPRAIGITSFPNLVQEELAHLHDKVCRFYRLTILSTVLGAILLGIAEPFLIPFFFGKSYMPAIVPALILLPNALFGGLSDLFGNALSSTGRTLHNTIASVVYVGTTLGSMTFTIHAWGIAGAAFSTGIGFMMSFLVRFVWYNVCIQRISLIELLPGYLDLKEVFHIGFGVFRRANFMLKKKLSVRGGSS
ncbi:lipopolysaccharide biosynthesis protein [Cohnella luojiensis]|uniref:Polysaccharide biosynthesis protein C-terminal domain-containing protein n=1 Tax=Cohnella luojiensis TaxID=652876 RepID=A0A4Y8LNY9_9BACL|nr:hypothetical protein [Cohnella luojiensis]TFE22642.1 hypothetical protein E2980_21480 [Cohnella luojiensis]